LCRLWPWVFCSNARSFIAATLVAVRPGAYRCEHVLLLREEATPALQCMFYSIDRPLPPLEKGQLVRWETPISDRYPCKDMPWFDAWSSCSYMARSSVSM
jgi:hypothetical protein